MSVRPWAVMLLAPYRLPLPYILPGTIMAAGLPCAFFRMHHVGIPAGIAHLAAVQSQRHRQACKKK